MVFSSVWFDSVTPASRGRSDGAELWDILTLAAVIASS